MQPTTTTTTPQKSSVQSLATTLNVDPAELQQIIVNTIMPAGATAEEVGALMLLANTYKLNPLLKQIAVFKTKNHGLMPMVMIDGWIKIMHDHPKFNGMEQVDSFDGDKSEWSVATKIYLKGIEHPISVKEYYDECYVPQKVKENAQNFDAAPWDKWPKRMLRHKSLIQGIRYALGIGGIYDQDELLRMDAIEAEVVPVNSYINGPQRVIPSYSDIEAAVKAMGLTLELRKEYGKDWAYAIGETFSVKAELGKLGFITKKNAQSKWDTKMDVTLNLQQKPPQLPIPKEINEGFDINTIQGLEQFISGNGFSMEIKPSGEKVFAKVNIDVNNREEVGFVTELGFKRVKDVYVRDVTNISSVA